MSLDRGDWRGLPDGSGTSRAALAKKISNPPLVRPGSFLKGKFVDLDDHMLVSWLPIVCVECDEELVLSPSGHQLCANPLCNYGFDVTLISQFVTQRCG
jgi:hypothetical protein